MAEYEPMGANFVEETVRGEATAFMGKSHASVVRRFQLLATTEPSEVLAAAASQATASGWNITSTTEHTVRACRTMGDRVAYLIVRLSDSVEMVVVQLGYDRGSAGTPPSC